MFRDAISKLSLRKKLIVLASVGVFLPVIVLTYMQYQSLTELQNKTKGAFKDNLRQGLTIVERQMKRRLEEVGGKTLEPIGRLSSTEEIETHFANVKSSHPEIKEIFVLRDKERATPAQSDIQTVFDRARMGQSFLDDNHKYLFAEGKYLFYPLKDGFAGVLLDEKFISDDLIAGTISKILNAHHDETASSSAIAIKVSDENQRVLYSNAPSQND